METNRIIVTGILAVIAIAAITLVGTNTVTEGIITGNAITGNVVGENNYGIYYTAYHARLSQRPGEASYQARVDAAARGAAIAQRPSVSSLSRLGRSSSTAIDKSTSTSEGTNRDSAAAKPTLESYGYNPYLDRQKRYSGVYVDNEFS